jgi:hypothetical protein
MSHRAEATRIGTLAALALMAIATPAAAQPALQGYSDYTTFSSQVEGLGKPAADVKATVQARSLGETLGGRSVWLLTLGEALREGTEPAATATDSKPATDTKPAILILGNVDAPHLVGSELAMRIAKLLTEKADSDAAVKQLLERHTVYIIPRPSPDASEAFFRRPQTEREGNDRPSDDDRDFKSGEDPPEDLNGDGLITQMRVEDPAGTLVPHPDEPRVLVTADAEKNERGQYRVYTEGRDNDGDEQFNEDPSGGVAFNRNFTFKYPYFERGAGPHQVSEIETRAVADFAFDHPNIALVFSFSPDDNLMHPWKPNPSAENQRIKTAVLAADAPVLDALATKYRELHGGKDAPDSPPPAGSFAHWAYFHFGRWSLSARAWWIPEVKPAATTDAKSASDAKPDDTAKPEEAAKPADESKPQDAAKPDETAKPADDTKPDNAAKPDETAKPEATEKPAASGGKSKKADDNRGAADRNALRWFDREKVTGFVPWTAIEHPDFPGRKVEVGGFVPYLRTNPPASELDALAEKHLQFLLAVAERLPRLAIETTKLESLGAGVYRLTVAVSNEGQMPTMPQMGRVSGQQYPVQLKIDVPEGVRLTPDVARVRVEVLAARGGRHEETWLIYTTEGTAVQVMLTAWAPAVGNATHTVELKP